MSSYTYLDYIPEISKNKKLNAILLTIVPAILYTTAAYGYLYLREATLFLCILFAITFASLEYIVRVPIIKYSSDEAKLSNGMIQFIWISLTLILATMTDLFPQNTKSTDLLDNV